MKTIDEINLTQEEIIDGAERKIAQLEGIIARGSISPSLGEYGIMLVNLQLPLLAARRCAMNHDLNRAYQCLSDVHDLLENVRICDLQMGKDPNGKTKKHYSELFKIMEEMYLTALNEVILSGRLN